MKIDTPLHAEHQLDQLAGQFEHWRQTRTRRRERIPQDLWDQAVALTRALPYSRVAHHLGLSSAALKDQIARQREPSAVPAPAPLGFVEVPMSLASASMPPPIEVEMHRADGAHLHLHAPDSALAELVRAFLEVR